MAEMILVVDDCEGIAYAIAQHLASAGYRVKTAHDGLQALEILETETPDCIVLDIMMPRMSGAELVRRLRRDPGTASIPIVLVSAKVADTPAHTRIPLDADQSVGKPFTRRQIVEGVRTAIRLRAKHDEPHDPSRRHPAVERA